MGLDLVEMKRKYISCGVIGLAMRRKCRAGLCIFATQFCHLIKRGLLLQISGGRIGEPFGAGQLDAAPYIYAPLAA